MSKINIKEQSFALNKESYFTECHVGTPSVATYVKSYLWGDS